MALSEIARHRCDWDNRCGHYAIHAVMMKVDPGDRFPSPCRLCEEHAKEAKEQAMLYDRTSFRQIFPDGTLGTYSKRAATMKLPQPKPESRLPEKPKFKSKFPQPMPANWRLGDPISFSAAWRDEDDLEDVPALAPEAKAEPTEKKARKRRTKRGRKPAQKAKQAARRTYTRNPKGDRLTDRVLLLLANKPWQTSKEIRESLDGYPHMSGLLGLLKRQEKISRLAPVTKQSIEGARYALKDAPLP